MDFGEVVKLVERLRDTITRYQVSEDRFVAQNTTYTVGKVLQQQAVYEQQQAISDKIKNLTVRVFCLVLIPYTDDRSCYQVFFQHILEASRGDADH